MKVLYIPVGTEAITEEEVRFLTDELCTLGVLGVRQPGCKARIQPVVDEILVKK